MSLKRQPSRFSFKNSNEAKQLNASILQSFDWDITKAIQAQPNSLVSFGSEFRSQNELDKLLSFHPLWTDFKEILTNGATFPLQPISKEERLLDLEFHLSRGNHKSAIKNDEALSKIIDNDISKGYALPLPLDIIKSIPNSSLAPLGCIDQDTINERGECTQKFRMTHDQSFAGPSSHSVNGRVIKELLPNCMYSFALLRLLHYIISVRERHPRTKIFISKFDLDSAYRRCHLSGESAAECLTIYKDTLLMALRMTFGGSPCPSMWGITSETITDVCNTLIHCKSWDYNTLYDNLSDSIPPPVSLPDNVPFAQTRELSINIPVNDLGKVDVFIDDYIAITPDIEDNTTRVIRAIPFAIHSVARPIDNSDDIPRVDIISAKKLHAEGTFEEVKVVLGWIINTRNLLISLPQDKHKKWTTDLNRMIASGSTSYKLLESTLGRLNHVAGIIPMLRHFLGRLRHALFRSSQHKWTKFRMCELADLHICLQMLDEASTGISINNIVFRKPNIFYRSDASEFGIGGYNLISGSAWRFELPIHLRLRSSLNSLEFLASVITIWVDILENKVFPEDCILSQSDSTSAIGWLRKSNFSDDEDSIIQMITARHLATLILKSKACLYSQWFPGGENSVADSLSRDFHLNDSNLSKFLLSSVPNQVPFGLRIKRLPNEISCWLTSMLQNLPEKEQWSKEPQRSSLWLGRDIEPISNQSAYATTITSTSFPRIRSIKSWGLSATQSEKVDFILHQSKLIKLNQFEPPWIMFHRPSSWLEGLTQDSIETASLLSFYKDNFEVTEPPMHQKNNKRPYQDQC